MKPPAFSGIKIIESIKGPMDAETAAAGAAALALSLREYMTGISYRLLVGHLPITKPDKQEVKEWVAATYIPEPKDAGENWRDDVMFRLAGTLLPEYPNEQDMADLQRAKKTGSRSSPLHIAVHRLLAHISNSTLEGTEGRREEDSTAMALLCGITLTKCVDREDSSSRCRKAPKVKKPHFMASFLERLSSLPRDRLAPGWWTDSLALGEEQLFLDETVIAVCNDVPFWLVKRGEPQISEHEVLDELDHRIKAGDEARVAQLLERLNPSHCWRALETRAGNPRGSGGSESDLEYTDAREF